jgi:hypothetical protein
VFGSDVIWTAEFAQQKWLYDMTPYMEKRRSEFLPAPLETLNYDGKLWGAPLNTDASLIYYRTDKTSGVPPLASGVVRAKIGNLTSANALRITLMGVLSRTARKRVTYGRGMAEMSRKVLGALDALGVFRTEPGERGVKLVWPDPLPEDVRGQTRAAEARAGLGVPRERVLAELGYSGADPGVQ